ncbi:MAG TPA: glycoside hydrolase family 36 protein [Pyrinomonadaceae bacterium]|nr:glycoside hydrolase family 36 protein [Pyrinomonadaceae bacterium]
MTKNKITRREVLNLALASPLLAAVPRTGHAQAVITKGFDQKSLAKALSTVVPVGEDDIKQVEVIKQWRGPLCKTRLSNRGKTPAHVKEVVLFDLKLDLPPETRLYGEGFQMLSQTGGILGKPVDLGNYTDAKHYKMPQPEGARVFHGVMTFAPPEGGNLMMAFTSCRRFNGQFYLRPNSLQIVVDTEGLEIAPGESWELEEFTFRAGADRAKLLNELGRAISVNHPPLRFKAPPTGWCSWYCFGPRVTAQQVRDNLDFIAKNEPRLKYIQIDDGYQPAMGDWLETGTAFGGNVQGVLKQIRERGFEPAIWVAPFIAEEKSHIFEQHPDWFVKDAPGKDGKPLRSDKVTFGGWRRGPWYVLDGTHPEVQKHFETLFSTMRKEWGCTYFKFDANFWGAMHGGYFHDQKATRIEAYRRGMQAILRGTGDGFVLGCNHPIWPSLGLIHGSRSSNDIKRSWDRIRDTGRQNLYRNWQNGRLWWNDPDAIVLTGELPPADFQFHATVIYASGGMILSGDDLTRITPDRLAMLKKLLPPTALAADFADDTLRVGVVNLPNARAVCVFNWDDKPQTISFPLARPSGITDFWSGQDLGRHERTFTIEEMPPRSARLIICK